MAKRDLNAAEVELSNTENELGKWLVPEWPVITEEKLGDEEVRERFNIWFGSGIQAQKISDGNYEIKWRKEPDGKDRHEYGL